jgi:Tol biopolymer transport system component
VVLCLAIGLVAPAPAVAAPAVNVDRSTTATRAPAAPLPPPAGTTTLVSFRFGGSASSGPAGGGPSAEPSISSNGRWVAFTSAAPDLVTGDTNSALDVFVLDRSTGRTSRLGLPGGAPVPPGGRASEPSISADGRIVAFTYQPPSTFSAAVAGSIVLAWDRRTGAVEIVSRNSRGATAAGSRQPSVSGDGRFVAYVSDNSTIAGKDGNGQPDVFRYDRSTGQSILISSQPDANATPAGSSTDPSISADGNVVAFISDAGDTLVREATGPGTQVYVRDVEAGRTERVSGTPGPGSGGPADGPSSAPSISADGRYVAFDSSASNLVEGDTNRAADVFRRDRTTSTTVLVSVTVAGAPATGSSGQAAISADGRMVAFASTAADLVAMQGGVVPAAVIRGASEVYIRDVEAADTVLVSVAPAGGPGGGQSLAPSVAGNGRFVAFASTATLVAGDANKVADVLLRDMPPVPRLNPAVIDLGARAVNVASLPAAGVLSNAGWGPLTVTGSTITGSTAADFEIVADSCTGMILHRSEACTVSVIFRPSKTGTRTAVLEVADNYTGSPRTARLRGSASLARVELDPDVGQPGIVTIATGTGFPANTAVKLRWSQGITPTITPVVTDAKGGFVIPVLVFHNDATGPRDLVVEPVDGTSFPPAGATMLVTQPPAVPPSFVVLRLIDMPLVLVIRG